MTQEKFEEIKALESKIQDKELRIKSIDTLISSCSLVCKITGTPKGTYAKAPEHYFSDKKDIIWMLQVDRERMSIELAELKRLFAEQ